MPNNLILNQNSPETAVSLMGVSKTIGKSSIVTNLTLEVRQGEIFGFLGPNGAGKTTTIRLITGLMKPTAGDITVMGYSVKEERSRALSQIGSIVEQPELYPFMTGWENLKQMARLHKGITDDRIREVVQSVKLTKNIRNKVRTYSLGMKQRLGIAQAILNRPKVLILDEPTNGLDPIGVIELRNMIKSYSKDQGMTVFVSSHILSEMEQLCGRIAIIHHGTVKVVEQIDGSKGSLEDKFLSIISEESI